MPSSSTLARWAEVCTHPTSLDWRWPLVLRIQVILLSYMQSVGPLSSRSCLESDNISEIKLNSRTMKTFEQVGSRLSSLLLMIILVGCIIHADAQFFAKSSKSIPRMGRRSGEPANPMDRYRRLLIDTFINGYGPGSFQTLEVSHRSISLDISTISPLTPKWLPTKTTDASKISWQLQRG